MRSASILVTGLLACTILFISSGCASFSDGGPTTSSVDKTCNRTTPCTHLTQVRTNGYFNGCSVMFPFATTTVPSDIDVSWTLPWKFFGHLEFTDPGVEFKAGKSADHDFTNGRFSADRGTFYWTSTSDAMRTKKPFDYKFGVIWVSSQTDPVKCGVIDPTIVNSL